MDGARSGLEEAWAAYSWGRSLSEILIIVTFQGAERTVPQRTQAGCYSVNVYIGSRFGPAPFSLPIKEHDGPCSDPGPVRGSRRF